MFRVQGSCSGFRVQGAGFMFRVQGSGLRVEGLGGVLMLDRCPHLAATDTIKQRARSGGECAPPCAPPAYGEEGVL